MPSSSQTVSNEAVTGSVNVNLQHDMTEPRFNCSGCSVISQYFTNNFPISDSLFQKRVLHPNLINHNHNFNDYEISYTNPDPIIANFDTKNDIPFNKNDQNSLPYSVYTADNSKNMDSDYIQKNIYPTFHNQN